MRTLNNFLKMRPRAPKVRILALILAVIASVSGLLYLAYQQPIYIEAFSGRFTVQVVRMAGYSLASILSFATLMVVPWQVIYSFKSVREKFKQNRLIVKYKKTNAIINGEKFSFVQKLYLKYGTASLLQVHHLLLEPRKQIETRIRNAYLAHTLFERGKDLSTNQVWHLMTWKDFHLEFLLTERLLWRGSDGSDFDTEFQSELLSFLLFQSRMNPGLDISKNPNPKMSVQFPDGSVDFGTEGVS